MTPHSRGWNKNLSINTMVATGILPAAAVPPFPEFLSSGTTEQGHSLTVQLQCVLSVTSKWTYMDGTRLITSKWTYGWYQAGVMEDNR